MARTNYRRHIQSPAAKAIAGQLGKTAVLDTSSEKRANSLKLDKPFPWTPASLKAAELLAENELSLNEVAQSVGVMRGSLWAWRQHPQFAEAVAERASEIVTAMYKHYIAKKHKRIAALDRLHKKALDVIDQRAKDPMLALFPGGNTGLLVRTEKQMGIGRNATTIVEAQFDRALVAEIRAIQEQAARELGQWVEKAEVAGTFSFTDLFAMVNETGNEVMDAAFEEVLTLDEVREALAANGD